MEGVPFLIGGRPAGRRCMRDDGACHIVCHSRCGGCQWCVDIYHRMVNFMDRRGELDGVHHQSVSRLTSPWGWPAAVYDEMMVYVMFVAEG